MDMSPHPSTPSTPIATLDFELARTRFLDYCEHNEATLNAAARAYSVQVQTVVADSVADCKVEWRVKDGAEAVRKFSRKYRAALEESGTAYDIRNYVTDLVGIRIICLYEDELDKVAACVKEKFDVIDTTDKVRAVENTEASFGYKGLHLDLRPPSGANAYGPNPVASFELQIRTVIQDSWSALDHKIKYKKAIPGPLKRRINVLAALFELADREFRQIRDATETALREAPDESAAAPENTGAAALMVRDTASSQLNAFTFLKIANHFFKDFEFEARKVDGFVEDIHTWDSTITRARFNHLVRTHIGTIKRYRQHLEELQPGGSFNPYTVIRHCLYLGDRHQFSAALRKVARTSFDAWLEA